MGREGCVGERDESCSLQLSEKCQEENLPCLQSNRSAQWLPQLQESAPSMGNLPSVWALGREGASQRRAGLPCRGDQRILGAGASVGGNTGFTGSGATESRGWRTKGVLARSLAEL